MKSYQYQNFDISEKYIIQLFGYCYVHVSGQRHAGLERLNSYTTPGTMMHVHFMFFAVFKNLKSSFSGERSGSVVECLTRDRGAPGLSLIGVTALWSLSKTHLS